MRLHLVGGFLGSGKTTAISQAAKIFMARGQRVGVVTNDQGKYLVDTAFMKLGDIPAVEVTGGCFCCNYDDLDTRLNQLQVEAKPDVIFAESVGSCADVVATVLKPLLELRQTPSTLSVFTDSRLLYRWLKGDPLPFSENVVYIFEQQIEEAGILVINKSDLLLPDELEEIKILARQKFPTKSIRMQNSLDHSSIREWVQLLEVGQRAITAPLSIDYDRYGKGEAELAWLDQRLTLAVSSGEAKVIIERFITNIEQAIRSTGNTIGHVKLIIEDETQQVKISLTSMEDAQWRAELPNFSGTNITILLNARVQIAAGELHQIVQKAIDAMSGGDVQVTISHDHYFHPGWPKPTHRIT